MDRATANQVLRLLKLYYPRQYPETMTDEKSKLYVDDFQEAFGKYDNEDVLDFYKRWHYENVFPPTVADAIRELRILTIDRKRAEIVPQEEVKGTPMPDYVREKLKKLGLLNVIERNGND